MTVEEARAKVAKIGAMLFERRLTDACGGNISLRVDDVVCMSPTYSGSHKQWQLRPQDVLIVDLNGNILEGNGKISRESNVHFGLHREFREYGTAVIHCHPRNLLVFAALNRPMPPVLEANLKFGEVKVIDYAPAHSPKLAENIIGAIRGQENRIKKHAAGVIAPWHGLFLMGKDLDAAFDAVERFDTNAYCILMAQMMGLGDALDQQRQTLAELAAAFKKDV